MFEPLIGRNSETDEQSVFSKIPNSSLHPLSLSDQNGFFEINVLDRLGVGSSVLVIESYRSSNIKFIECETWRLDDYFLHRDFPQPDFIKLDTQASELKILQSSINI